MSPVAAHAETVSVRVRLPSPLRSYAGGAVEVAVEGPWPASAPAPTLDAVLVALDSRFPGLRFRIVNERGELRPHVRLFVGGTMVRDLQYRLGHGRELMIVAALSGG